MDSQDVGVVGVKLRVTTQELVRYCLKPAEQGIPFASLDSCLALSADQCHRSMPVLGCKRVVYCIIYRIMGLIPLAGLYMQPAHLSFVGGHLQLVAQELSEEMVIAVPLT